jgi:cob(I)alamin adenosyltransferase
LVPEPDSGQTWHNWPIRLYKCAKSLQEFGCITEFNSVRKYARLLIKQGVSFEYNGRDLSTLFH